MFAAPKIIETEVFYELPSRFRRFEYSQWAEVNNRGAATHNFLEGPAFSEQGVLYVTDIPFGRIFAVSPDGQGDLVFEYDGHPIGMKVLDDNTLIVADYKLGLLQINLEAGRQHIIAEGRFTERFQGLNDLTITNSGTIYFTDQGQTGLHNPGGRVYRMTGSGQPEIVIGGLPAPNGLVLNEDETALYVAVTRANAVWRANLMTDGSISKLGNFIQMSGGSGPDGLAIDIEGNIVVAHAGLGGVWHFNKKGLPIHFVRSCRGNLTTNIAYGGDENRDLFITESSSGCILRARMPLPGMPLNRRVQ